MAIKINFDTAHNTEIPTLVLANKNGDKIGKFSNITNVKLKDNMNDVSEISFTVHKKLNNKIYPYWDFIKNFKLVWCKEWDIWFELTVDFVDSEETIKNVSLKRLGQAELSQIMLYNIEINTENDIAREDYDPNHPTILYNPNYPEASLLHRIMEKAPHYSIKHVDATIASIQRTFQFDDKSIKDALDEIAEEINCLVVYDSDSYEDGSIKRTISLYDLESNCLECGYRGEFTKICPKCNSEYISEGYGEDTTICVSKDDLGEEITLKVDTDSVKNCFRLEAGDDLMTATIKNCNPNGSQYIWNISDDIKLDMTPELVNKINNYDKLYKYYQKEYELSFENRNNYLSKYNELVEKYKKYNVELENIESLIVGYSNLMQTYYNTIDLALFIDSGLMPTWELSDTTAEEQGRLLTTNTLSPVAVLDISYISLSTANSSVLAMAKCIIDSRYDVKVKESSINNTTWTGSFTVTNYSDEEDTYDTSTISIIINSDYEIFVNQKIQKTLNKNKIDCAGGVSALFDLENLSLDEFKEEITKYCLNSLNSFRDACQACIDVLTEQGISDGETWANQNPNLYQEIYMPYYNRLNALLAEIQIKEAEINFISSEYSNDDNKDCFQTIIKEEINKIQIALDLKQYLGTDLWLEFSSYRREDKYENSNYISDGLDNAELFKNALEFIETAEKEIYKSSNYQHQITAKMKNFLVIKEFKPLLEYFECGNWLRIKIDDTLYKLRLLSYELDYDDIENLSVTFSDIVDVIDGVSDVENIIKQASNMATSYDSVKRQATQGADSNSVLNNWSLKGLDITNTKIVSAADDQNISWDKHGFLCRQYDEILDTYNDEQLKIINKGLYLTNDNWKSSKTAIGKFYYFDPINNEMKTAYGVNGELLVGKLILGENLGIYNTKGSMTFNDDGLTVTNGINTVTINPNNTSILSITKSSDNLLSFDTNGNMIVKSEIQSTKGNIGGWDISSSGLKYQTSDTDFLALKSSDKSIISQSGEYKSVLTSGKLKFYINNTEYSSFTPAKFSGTTVYGTDVRSEVNSKFIAFGNKKNSSDTVYTTNFLLNYGLNPNGYTEDVLIYGTSRFLDKIHLNNYLYFNNGHYLSAWVDTLSNGTSINGVCCSGVFSTNYRVLVGNINYGYKLSVDGGAWISGNLYCNGGKVHGDSGSDVRIKKNFSSLNNIKNLYMGFKPKQYKYKEVYYKDKNIRDENYHFGLIAQEVINNFINNGLDVSQYNIVEETKCFDGSSESGLISNGKKLMINYENLHALHIAFGQEIYKELTDKIEKLENRVKELEEN